MVKIRKSCFETNSSSTHALCLDMCSKYEHYTKEQLNTFEKIIYPFSPKESSKFNDPHVFFKLEDKLRYFWTIFIREYISSTAHEQEEFMCRLQMLVPNVSFAYKFPDVQEDGWTFPRGNAAYMEDSSCVLDDTDSDSIVKWTIAELEAFLETGVIVFGNRDAYDYRFYESIIDLFIHDNGLKVIEEYTG